MQTNLEFKEGICSIKVSGIPDHSLGQTDNNIGILLSWKIRLIGYTTLDGDPSHLSNLSKVILTYANYCVSGSYETVSDELGSITIAKSNQGHQLRLVSTKEYVKPLTILLDDAELCDLSKCLDQLNNSPNVTFDLKGKLKNRQRSKLQNIVKTKTRNLLNPFIGLMLVVASAFLYLIIPSGIEQDKVNTIIERQRTTNRKSN